MCKERLAATLLALVLRSFSFAQSILALALAALVLLVSTRQATAHEVGLSRGDYTVGDKTISASLVFASKEILKSVPSVDANDDGELDESELEAARKELAKALFEHVKVTADGEACTPDMEMAVLHRQDDNRDDGVELKGAFTCDGPARTWTFDLSSLLETLSDRHRHVAFTTVGTATLEHVTFAGQATFRVHALGEGEAPPAPSVWDVAVDYFVLGVEHIWIGIDHLAFLLGLVLLGGRIRALIAMVTAFSVAHSITLALSVLDIARLSPGIVEPAIALSVAYVGIENWFAKHPEKRWRLALPFGLIHGFGFAGVLGEIGVPPDRVPSSLLFFNLGVEIGQLAVLAVIMPVIYALRKRPWFVDKGVKSISAGIALAGIAWFVQRVFF